MWKKLTLIACVLLLFQFKDTLFSFTSPAADYAALHEQKVILYATSWCGYCRKARKFLEQNNISYYEYDIENSSEGYQQFKALGGRGVPVLLVNGRVIMGFDSRRIIKYLQ